MRNISILEHKMPIIWYKKQRYVIFPWKESNTLILTQIASATNTDNLLSNN